MAIDAAAHAFASARLNAAQQQVRRSRCASGGSLWLLLFVLRKE